MKPDVLTLPTVVSDHKNLVWLQSYVLVQGAYLISYRLLAQQDDLVPSIYKT